jgi:hypothetical protein
MRKLKDIVGQALAFAALVICVLTLPTSVVQLCPAAEQTAPLPQWLLKAIEADKKSPLPGSFEEATYEGKRVFQFTRGDRDDTGDEHILFSEDGREICRFGGLAGRVTSGVCSIGRIIYVRTL